MKVNFKKIICAAVFSAIATISFAEDATVVSVTGKVEVNRKDQWVALNANSKISEGEVISTGFNSEALIRYNGSVMRLGPLTRITLEKLATSEKKDDVSVYVSTGAVRSTVKHTENKRVTYTVRNPVAVASVRGTDFMFIGTGKTTCYNGAVALMSASEFNAKARGITKPADKTDAATEEDAKKAEATVPGTGNSAEDVNPYEKGGVLIQAGQTSEIDPKTGTPKPASSHYQVKQEKIEKKNSTPSNAEVEISDTNSSTKKTTLSLEMNLID